MQNSGRLLCLQVTWLASAILMGIATATLAAETRWVKLTTPHFELYTTAGEKNGRDAVVYFEHVRSFFLQAGIVKRIPDTPVRIIAFHSEKEYKPYQVRDFTPAYYMQGQSGDYIVMQSVTPDQYQVAIHEYAHLVVKHTKLRIPLWLNEGIADLFSSLRPEGRKTLIGTSLPSRAAVLAQADWMDLPALLAVQHGSPEYNERGQVDIFYAQSWLLAHMLMLSEKYGPQFPAFLSALTQDMPAEACFQKTYGKALNDVQQDLRDYFASTGIRVGLYNINLRKNSVEPEAAQVPALESDLVLADLLTATGKLNEARAIAAPLVTQNPKNADIEAMLGYLSLRERNAKETLSHFAKAVQYGSRNPRMFYHFALLGRQTGSKPDSVLALLQKAVELQPDYSDARLTLGLFAIEDRRWEEGLSALRSLPSVELDQAFRVYSAISFASLQTGNKAEARKAAELAKRHAKGPQQVESADHLLSASR